MDNEYFASINSVSQDLGIPAYTLRYWEKQFPTVVRPVAGAGGRRYYRPEMVARLRTIKDLLYNRGLTIAGVKKMIRSGEFSALDTHESWTPAPRPRPEPRLEPRLQSFDQSPRLQSVYDDFMNERPTGPASIDLTKLDVAVDLLHQARELLN
ncbi:MAG: MerR family transcriptional regulator [Alphaproteobacteria bacterium]|nr:MerR family transcriptional regulator [Alphaproteobacteria bacterium]